MTEFRKLMAANRGEIAIRVFRSAHELGIRTVAIYSHEDRFAIHRLKADEAYQVGRPGEPIRSYLEHRGDRRPGQGEGRRRDPSRLRLPVGERRIRPGLRRGGHRRSSARGPSCSTCSATRSPPAGWRGRPACPSSRAATRRSQPGPEARAAGRRRSAIPSSSRRRWAAAAGGCAVVESADALDAAIDQARREAGTAFGVPDVFIEKFLREAKHIEVQILGDRHGNLRPPLRARLLGPAPAPEDHRDRPGAEPRPGDPAGDLRRRRRDRPARRVRQRRAPSSSWSTSTRAQFYFIEVNPRIQVEHTVTEIVTGVDLVKSQILIAGGAPLSDPEIDLPDQDAVQRAGISPSSAGSRPRTRRTSSRPTTAGSPTTARPAAWASGLDGGPAITGGIITPFYDSLLVKISRQRPAVHRRRPAEERALQEFRVRGVKTNVPFLLNVVDAPDFLAGDCTTRFLDETPELFRFPIRQDRATRLLTLSPPRSRSTASPASTRPTDYVRRAEPAPPQFDPLVDPPPEGSRQRFQDARRRGASRGGSASRQPLLLTDTTFRDAHQSLLATRVRTRDMVRVADAYARLCPGMFSIEMWGGATFDTSMRFLKEDPWDRLAQLREKIPNILFQMLLRGSNAVGYTSYPDNVVKAFVKEAAAAGIDLFRVFDSLNWVPNMELVARGRPRGRGALRGRHLLHRRHPRPGAGPSTTWPITSDWPGSWRSGAPT